MRFLGIGLVVLMLLPGRTAAAGPKSVPRIGGSVTTHGMVLSFRLPNVAYARSSLVMVTIRARNLTKRALVAPAPASTCSGATLDVLNAAGKVLYPPVFPGIDDKVRCTAGIPRVLLKAGGAMKWQTPVILRGAHLRLVATLPLKKPVSVQTNTIAVRLVGGGQGPRTTLHTSGRVYVQFVPRAAVTGPLLFSFWQRCTGKSGSQSSFALWQTTSSSSLQPSSNLLQDKACTHREWHVLAGWSGQPAAHADYASS